MSLLENYHSDLSNLILCFVLVSQLSDSFPHCGPYPTRLPCQWDSLGKNTGVGCQFLLQELFLTYGLNPGLPHCSLIIYQLNHQGSPHIASVLFSSFAQLCPTFCDPMNCSTPGLPVHHQLPQFTQTHVHRVSDAIQPSHPLSSPSPPAPNPSQHQSLFQ